MSLDGVLKKYEDLTTLKFDLEKVLDVKIDEDITKKTIFNFNNIITIKKDEKQKINKDL